MHGLMFGIKQLTLLERQRRLMQAMREEAQLHKLDRLVAAEYGGREQE